MDGEFKTENDALLTPDDEKSPNNGEPKRNTKRAIIAKIKELCEEHGLTLHESDTTLQRSSKTQLHKLLAQKTEALIAKKMRDSLNQDAAVKTDDMKSMMAVATLNYGLNTLNRILDRGANMLLPRVGYELDGFMDKFEDPRTQAEIVDILKLIIAEHPEMLEHISSPYIRLGLVYVGCVSMSLRKIPTNRNGAIRRTEPQKIPAVRPTNGREPQARKVVS
jgi:hypothetical protein